MIIIDTDGDPLDPADRCDGDLVFKCDTAAGTHRVYVCLAPCELPDIEDSARVAQGAAEDLHGVGGNSSAMFDGEYRRGL